MHGNHLSLRHNHLDPKGHERLKKLLSHLAPDTLTLEGDKKSAETSLQLHEKCNQWFKTPEDVKRDLERISCLMGFSKEQRENIDPNALYNFLRNSGYEHWVAAEYSRSANVPIEFLEIQTTIDGLVTSSSDRIRKVLAESLSLPLDELQERVDLSYQSMLADSESAELLQSTPRNRYMALEIMRIGGIRHLMIGWGGHIFGNSPNIYDLLKEAGSDVERINLIEADPL